jgi:peptidoglycan hydrolase-like protein with peptidoglycan-binding domain
VQTWLTNNGFDTKGIDNMYGANTKAAIDKLLNDTTFGLTDEEKQKFRNFQNSATFYRAKVRKPNPPVVPTQEEISPYLTGTIA